MADPDIDEIILSLLQTEEGRELLDELAREQDENLGQETGFALPGVQREDLQPSGSEVLAFGTDGFSISPKIDISGGTRGTKIPVETREGPSSIKNSEFNVGAAWVPYWVFQMTAD